MNRDAEAILPMRLVGVVLALALAGDAVLADDYADARARLVAAYQQQDYATMVDAGEQALTARPAYPGALFNLALAHALNNDPAGRGGRGGLQS